MILFVGLGNPGTQYALNRHNVGFMVVDVLADHFSFSAFKRRGEAVIAEGEIASRKVTLLKPMNFMNRSGISVSEFAHFFKIPLEDIIVAHDDLDLVPGKVKIKQGGGAGGHNGLRSLDAHLGQDYWRLRVGIGHPGHRDAVHSYVLKNFSREEEDWLVPLLQALTREASLLVQKDMSGFLNNLALRLREA